MGGRAREQAMDSASYNVYFATLHIGTKVG
jgi:hypothetical protein